MEYKKLPHFVKSIEDRTVTGIVAVHGNIDSGGDVSINGAFSKRLGKGRNRTRFLWQHDDKMPPIASIKSLREIGRDELPEKVLEYAPEATGGLEISREYYPKEASELSNWIFHSIKMNDVEEMSYGYIVHESEYDNVNGRKVRILKDIELLDCSDVLWGMNPATAGVKSAYGDLMSFTQHSNFVVSTVEDYLERVQDRKEFRESEGRKLSETNLHTLQGLKNQLDDLTHLIDGYLQKENLVDGSAAFAQFLATKQKIREQITWQH